MENSSHSAHYALQVALQTMKERCVALQKRVSTVEAENYNLRERLTDKNSSQDSRNTESLMENNQLRLQIVELNRQKNQLSEHLTMVSNENRKLWSRLSQISKEQDKMDNSETTLVNDIDTGLEGSPKSTIHQNLIRSKTFTQHSPNPNLRQKLISNKIPSCNDESDLSKMSLEEITLERKNSFKEQNFNILNDDGNPDCMEFGYLNDYNAEDGAESDSDDVEFTSDLKNLLEKMHSLKQLALQQREEMVLTTQSLQNKSSKICNECINKSQKPEMADKSLETDESLHDPLEKHITTNNFSQPLNVVAQKISANEADKICPICGKKYDDSITFGAFQEHVEYHFIDETSDLEPSIERNFEYISHTVGDF